MEDIILLGFGGHAKSVVDTIEQQKKFHIIGFLDKEEKKEYQGYKVIGQDSDLMQFYRCGIKYAFVTVGYLGRGGIRETIYRKLKKIGYCLPVIIDDSAILAVDACIEEGTYVGKGAVINANAHVEKMCIINTNAVVEHDCYVGEYSHIAVGTVVCGGSKIGRSVLVGANATVIQMRNIGDRVIIGAGSIILSDVADGKKICGIWKGK